MENHPVNVRTIAERELQLERIMQAAPHQLHPVLKALLAELDVAKQAGVPVKPYVHRVRDGVGCLWSIGRFYVGTTPWAGMQHEERVEPVIMGNLRSAAAAHGLETAPGPGTPPNMFRFTLC